MITAVLFDLDDTLSDANSFAVHQLVRAVAMHGYALDADELLQYVGPRYVPLLQELLGVPLEVADAIYATYVQRYREQMPGNLQEIDGASELLIELDRRKFVLGIVTNKLEGLAREIVSQFAWDGFISVVIGQDTCEFAKPHPGIVRHAVEVIDVPLDQTAFVGDSVQDMRCASGAGLPIVIGLRGTTSDAELIEAGATHLCSGLNEVLSIVTAG